MTYCVNIALLGYVAVLGQIVFCAEVVVLDKIAFLGKVAAGAISSILLAGIAMTLSL